MSCCHGPAPQDVRPGTARVLVTELSSSGSVNPTPATKTCEDLETAVEHYLSPERLVSFQKCLRVQPVLIPLLHPAIPCLFLIRVMCLTQIYSIYLLRLGLRDNMGTSSMECNVLFAYYSYCIIMSVLWQHRLWILLFQGEVGRLNYFTSWAFHNL